MAGVKSVELQLDGINDLALLGQDDSIWLVVPLRWWDLATVIWWWMCPADKRAKVTLTMVDGKKVNVRAIRVATKHVRVRGLYR